MGSNSYNRLTSDATTDFLAPGLAKAGRRAGLKLPKLPKLPGVVQAIDTAGQKEYTKARMKSKQGRQSTILSNLGTQNQGKKTVLS